MSNSNTAEQSTNRWKRIRWARRCTQLLFLLLFLFLIFATRAITGADVDAKAAGEMPYPVEAFLDIDPLLAAITVLTTGVVPGALIYSLVIFVTAVFLGRAFCGWVCPMGTLNHIVSEARKKIGAKKLIERNKTRPYQKIKYLILIGVLVTALFGSAIGGLVDPISLATRGLTVTALPWIDWILGGALKSMGQSNIAVLQHTSDAVYDAASGAFLQSGGLSFSGGILITLVFVAVLIANLWIMRFWCRGLCPLGAMLGVSGSAGILTLKKDSEACTDCGLCQKSCSGAASPRPGDLWHRSECDLCMNCVASCKDEAIQFGLSTAGITKSKKDERTLPDFSRRQLIASTAAAAAIVPTLRTGILTSADGRPDPSCIRPPGAVEEREFLKRCIRCAQCMKICPNNALHPALDEAGIEGLWSPVLIAKKGYCEPTCTLCTQVCPTAAIKRVTENQKTGKNQEEMVRIGTAFFDRGRCLPWAMGIPCTVCEEFCPVSPKAIWLETVEVEVLGKKVALKRPYVDPAKCNGCGACEFVCPVHDRAAIRVTSAGESRSSTNQLLLKK